MLRLGKILLLAAFIAYPFWLHNTIATSESGGMQLLLVLLPLLAGIGWWAFRSVNIVWWPLLGLAIGALPVYLVLGEHERIGLIAVTGISHASFNLFMMWFFGHTLFGGREPLITRIARLMHGELCPEIASYTRSVTAAWSAYFALQVIVSAALYSLASITAWSFFINVLNLPLLALMFIGEYLYRIVVHPAHPRASIWRTIEVYAKDLAAPRKQNP
ncbi:hypothetical protein MIZ01_0270 [Sideroxyarcus emersonii]|uniref:Transmembrane protein n=1 Tax=Sideroxyarcus emersonii TaxID=2764705 RepID=A0AAN1X8K8_9PROT|nr:hypothetical protein [Sideroxyarcus emersonii]BCK86508.1 hypothetical protein MIZ01_0270 [Sideroxyarcus emersonii]